MFTNQFGTTTIGDRPILPDLHARDGPHAPARRRGRRLLAILFAVGIGVYSALRQYSVFDYSTTTFSFVQARDAGLLARSDAQVLFVYIYQWTKVRIFYVANLSGVDPAATSTSYWTVLSTSRCRCSCSWSQALPRTRGTCGPRCSGGQLRLRPHRAHRGLSERSVGTARLPERADPARHDRRAELRRAARRRGRDERYSASTGWASTSSTP